MKKIKLKNIQIASIYNALDAIAVEGFALKRGKGRLQRALSAKFEEYKKDEQDIREEYFEKNEDGEMKTKVSEDGNKKFVWKSDASIEVKEKANKQLKELHNEEVVIDLVEYETKIRTFFEGLKKDEFKAEDKLKDDDFELLVDILESAFDKKEVEKDANK